MAKFICVFRVVRSSNRACRRPSSGRTAEVDDVGWGALEERRLGRRRTAAERREDHPRCRQTVTDGPYAEAKDLVTGSLIVTAGSLDDATRLAAGCPIFEFDGSVEVRPVFQREGM